MNQLYNQLNSKMRIVLSIILLICVMGTLPLVYDRLQTEQSSKKVDIVFDYRDLLGIASVQQDSKQFIANQLQQMKSAGIHSLAVYESTLDELQMSQRIELYDGHEVTLLSRDVLYNNNFTYVVFPNEATQQKIEPIIKEAFARNHITVDTWTFQGKPGMIIEMPLSKVEVMPMDPDPMTMEALKSQGFELVARLTTHMQDFNAEHIDKLLAQLKQLGVRWIVFDGKSVTGFSYKEDAISLSTMAQLMNKYHIGAASIEFTPQAGLSQLASESHYDIIRLHSLSDKEAARLDGDLAPGQIKQEVQKLNDRFVLAVKERNIRMIFINAKETQNKDTMQYTNPLHGIYASLSGGHGAIQRIENAGYTMGTPTPFTVHTRWQQVLSLFALVGGVILITLMISYYFPSLLLAAFVLGVLGTGLLYKVSPNLIIKIIALGGAISAPTIAVILAVQSIQRYREKKMTGLTKTSLVIFLFIRSVMISLIAAVFTIGLMNHVTFFLLLDQFRGVSLLHAAPILLITIYLFFFREKLTWMEKFTKAKAILQTNITVLWVIVAVLFAGIGVYYLTRTGNSGQVSSLERTFRALLEDHMGIRPRTKEFLIGHPWFIFGAYLSLRYAKAFYFFIIGVIGQLSLDDTFAHLHTPVVISFIRVTYGSILGIVIGVIWIILWEAIIRGWSKWEPLLRK